MRLLLTSDLHQNHPRSKPLAEELIEQINRTDGDVLVLIGDTAVLADGALEACLSRIKFGGEKLFVPGNHELWTRGSDSSYQLHQGILPAKVRQLGWRWLPGEAFVADTVAIVGSLGWYDYSFAQENLGIPRRFYEAKVSPGAANRLEEFSGLLEKREDVSEHAMNVIARWNDGKFVKLHRTDEAFLDELLATLRTQLDSLRDHPHVIAAVHQLPFRELLPPPKSAQWDFAKAYLGSERIGQLLLEYPNVREVFCGHSHFPAEATVGHIRAKNMGCGYHHKQLEIVDV
jgi:3',5'-cyclic AMP phosphodiesterase CpdA